MPFLSASVSASFTCATDKAHRHQKGHPCNFQLSSLPFSFRLSLSTNQPPPHPPHTHYQSACLYTRCFGAKGCNCP